MKVVLLTGLLQVGLYFPQGPVEDPCAHLSEVDPSDAAPQLLRNLEVALKLAETGKCPQAIQVLRTLVKSLYAVGEYVAAEKACATLIHLNEAKAEGLLDCAGPLARLGKVKEASSLIERFIDGYGDDKRMRLRALLAGSAVMEENARFNAAADLLEKAFQLAPDDNEIARRLVKALLMANRAVEAANAAKSAALRLRDTVILRDTCLQLVRRGKSSNAKELAMMLSTNLSELRDVEAVTSVAKELKDRDLARVAAERYVSISGENLSAVHDVCLLLERHGFASIAAQILEKDLSKRTDFEPSEWLRLGHLKLLGGMREEAKADFSRYLREAGASPKDILAVADEWQRVKMHGWAVEVLREGISKHKTSRELIMALGNALHETGDDESEAALYEKASNDMVDKAKFWLDVGNLYSTRKNYKLAEKFYRMVIGSGKADVETAFAHIGLAETLVARGRDERDQAERELLEALSKGGNDQKVLDGVQKVARSIGMSSSLAIAVLQRKALQSPEDASLWWQLASAYLENRQGEMATEAFERYVSLSSDQTSAQSNVIEKLLETKQYVQVIKFLRKYKTVTLAPLADKIGSACLEIGNRTCAAKYFDIFLSGPVHLERDYLELAKALTSAGLLTLAKKAIETAARIVPQSRAFEVEMERGRVLLMGRSFQEAESCFERAVSLAPGISNLTSSIAREYASAGRLMEASHWFEKAFAKDISVLPEWLEVEWRLGHSESIQRLSSIALEITPANPRVGKSAATVLIRAGFAYEAALILKKYLDKAVRDRAEVTALWARLMILTGQIEELRRLGEDVCKLSGEEASESECVEIARKLADALYPQIAGDLLRKATERGAKSAGVELASLLLKINDLPGARKAALDAAKTVTAPKEFINVLGPAFTARGAWEIWLDILAQLAARTEFAASPDLLIEIGRAQLATGRLEGAMVAFEGFLGASKGGEARVYRELVSFGMRTDAINFISNASPKAIAAWSPADLLQVSEDLVQWGYLDIALQLLEKYRKGNEQIPSANEVVGRVQTDLGWYDEAIETFSRISKLSGSGRMALVKALWLTGARREALNVALDGLKSIQKEEIEEWTNDAIDFFSGEDAVIEAATIIERLEALTEVPIRLRILRARLLQRNEATRDDARREFIEAVSTTYQLTPDILTFVRYEASDGSLSLLRQALINNGPSSFGAQLIALFAACLERDTVATGQIAELMGPLNEPNALHELAVAEVFFECGYWREASDYAAAALVHLGADQDPYKAARLAAIAGILAGRPSVTAEIERILEARTDDNLERLHSVAQFRHVLGDLRDVAKKRFNLMQLSPFEPVLAQAALEAAIEAHDETLRLLAERQLLKTTEDRMTGVQRVYNIYRKYLMDDQSLPLLKETLDVVKGDVFLRWMMFESALRAGRWTVADDAAKAFVAVSSDQRLALADVVATAASQLGEVIVDRHLHRLLDGPKDARVARSLMFAAFMKLRLGNDAKDLIRTAVSLAPDPEDVMAMMAQEALVDAAVPYVFEDAQLKRPPDSIPMVAAARCLLGKQDIETCKGSIQKLKWRPFRLFMAAAGRALALRDMWAAIENVMSAVKIERTRAIGLQFANNVAMCLSGEKPSPERREIGKKALTFLETPGLRPDPALVALRAHLLEMVESLKSGQKVYEDELRFAPADASTHNNLGYLVSISGGDQHYAIREARMAELLNSRNNGYYIETEAWARFLAGDIRDALKLQEQARRLWNLEQEGGLAESLIHLGQMLEAVGRLDDAREAYRRAATLEAGRCAGLEALMRMRNVGVQRLVR